MPSMIVNDVSLYYEMTGSGDPVLLLHGLGSSTRDWFMQVPALAQSHTVITLDVRGHGQSGKPPGPYHVTGLADDAAKLLSELGMSPAHIVGVSMGGMIALQMGVDHPEAVRSLTVINMGAHLQAHSMGEHAKVWLRLGIQRVFGLRGTGWILSEQLFPEDEYAELRHIFRARWQENDRDAYWQAMRACIGWSVEEDLPHIAAPTLYLCADGDYSPSAYKEDAAAHMTDARVQIIHNARHGCPITHADEVNAAILTFIDGVPVL